MKQLIFNKHLLIFALLFNFVNTLKAENIQPIKPRPKPGQGPIVPAPKKQVNSTQGILKDNSPMKPANKPSSTARIDCVIVSDEDSTNQTYHPREACPKIPPVKQLPALDKNERVYLMGQCSVICSAIEKSLNQNLGNQFDFAVIEETARKIFHSKIIPGIVERFTAMGGEGAQRSGSFREAVKRTTRDFEARLAVLKSQYGWNPYCSDAIAQYLLSVGTRGSLRLLEDFKLNGYILDRDLQ